MRKILPVKARARAHCSSNISKNLLSLDTVEVKIFQNKNNKQFNLPVLKKHTSPQIIKDILNNDDVVGLKFKITDVIFKKNGKANKFEGGKI